MEHFAKLQQAIYSIEDALRSVKEARDRPAITLGRINRLEVSGSYYGHKPNEDEERLMRRAKELLADLARVEEEAKRQQSLKEMAVKLEAIRVILPSLAAEVCMEIGVTARALVAEAGGA